MQELVARLKRKTKAYEKILIAGLASMLIFSSFQEKKEVTLTLEIKNFSPDLLKIWDGFEATSWRDNLKTEGGKFVITLPINNPCIRTFIYGPNYKRIFLYPGQTLEISFDPENFAGTFNYGGNLATENIILDSVKSRIEKVDYTYLYAQSSDIALSYIDSAINADNQYFEKLISDKQTTPVFNEFTKASILYHRAYLKIMLLERQKGFKDPKHYNFLNQITIENDKYLDIQYYQWFLYDYISMETGKRYVQLDSIQKLSTGANFNEKLKVIGDMKNHNVREFSLAYTINSRLQGNGIKNFDKYYDYFKKHNSNPGYSELIRKEYEKKQLLAPGKPAPQFTLADVDGNQVSLSDFKGKYVFIDFWQTLCPNSARELPHYLKLYSDYKDENIAFVSISINEDENVWRNYVKQNKNVGTSLRADKYIASEVYKAYQVPGLQFIVIIDKEGNIIDPAAAKPSSKEIRETLDQLLKGK
jgi:peroxiredoxin